MYFEDYIENGRLCRNIDPAIYNFLFTIKNWIPYVRSIFSCQGHRRGEPAWFRFEIVDNDWWVDFTNRIEKAFSFAEIDKNTLQVYHKDKTDLFYKMIQLKSLGDRICRERLKNIKNQKKKKNQDKKNTRRKAERQDRKSTRLNSSHIPLSRMPSSA